jgi:hypothetical protein
VAQLQFRLSSLFWVMTWAGAWLGTLAFVLPLFDKSSPMADYPTRFRVLAGAFAIFACFATPIAAIGALVGNAKRGIIIGCIVAVIAFIAFLFIPLVPAGR